MKPRNIPLTGNKGEWSEVYVLLKLLAEGRLFAAGADLKIIKDSFKPIIKIIREESEISKIEYLLNGAIKVKEGETGKPVIELPIATFISEAKKLFAQIKLADKNSFSILECEKFLKSIKVNKLKTKSADKADIIIVVRDLATGHTPQLSFSIKSLIGKEPTLLNPSQGTNFIYKITHKGNKRIDVAKFNRDTYSRPKITNRINRLIEEGFELKFHTIESTNFLLNLKLLDGDLPRILGELLVLKYKNRKARSLDLLKLIEDTNPMNYDLAKGHPFYRYKLTSLFYDYALGMTPEVVWKGQYNANGGIIIAKNNSEVVCYHIYDKNLFQKYLIDNTKFEQASTGEDEKHPGTRRTTKETKKYYYGWLYEENGDLFMKLNLQIRFVQ